MLVSAIAAAARNGIIGDGADIPWRLSADLKYFKKVTTGHAVIMGRKTFDSVGKPLPLRTNIILTRDPFFTATGTLVAHTLTESLELAYEQGETEVFILGGGDIYQQSSHLWDKLYLTEVDHDAEGNVSFPDLNWEEWTLLSAESHPADDKNDYPYTFKVFERKKSA